MKRVRLSCTMTLLGSALLCSAAPVRGQAGEWLAWQGCWQAEGAPAGEYLCVVPDGLTGVQMVTVAGGAVVAESRVVTDGRARRVETEGCSGSEAAFWSADYQRVFLSSDLSCDGGVRRQASGVFAITSDVSWLSVQAVTIDGRTATRTVSYTAAEDDVAPASVRSALRASTMERVAARGVAVSPIDAGDVNEAVTRIDAAAVQEWLEATGQPFQLAGELAPAVADAVTRSALDHTGYFTYDRQVAREVHVVERPVEVVHVIERPVHVTHTYVHEHRYRACWDPFFSGVVVGLSHEVGLGLGRTHCGRHYTTHYSPWGYDLFGWRFVHMRPIIVAGRPVVHYRTPSRSPRLLHTARRGGERHTVDPRAPARPRTDYPVRTAQPRRDPPAARSTPVRERVATPRDRTVEPRRTAPPPRVPVLTRERREPVVPAPTRRSTEPRAAIPTRTPAPVSPRSTTPARVAQPRTSAPARAPESRATPTPRATRAPAATPSASAPRTRATPTLRTARPRAGAESRR